MLVRPNPRRVARARTTRVLTAAVACLLLILAAFADPQSGTRGTSGASGTARSAATDGSDAARARAAESDSVAVPAGTRARPESAVRAAVEPARRVAAPAHKNTKKTKKAARRARPKRHAVARRHAPGRPVTAGHYIRSLTGRGRDLVNMRMLGARDAAHNGPGQHVVLMDIGGQTPHGVFLSTTHKFVSYRSLAASMSAYVDGYHAHQRRGSTAIIAIGTNNDLFVNASAGAVWANAVVDPVAAHAKGYAGLVIAGADDVEPGFRAGPAATRAWIRGYLRNTAAPFLFNGSADGCSGRLLFSRCGGGWTTGDLAAMAGLMAPKRILVLPQVYNRTMATQWAQIARYAQRRGHQTLHILGPLTENAACGGDPYCPTMPSGPAGAQLWASLHKGGVRTAAVPALVDLDVR